MSPWRTLLQNSFESGKVCQGDRVYFAGAALGEWWTSINVHDTLTHSLARKMSNCRIELCGYTRMEREIALARVYGQWKHKRRVSLQQWDFLWFNGVVTISKHTGKLLSSSRIILEKHTHVQSSANNSHYKLESSVRAEKSFRRKVSSSITLCSTIHRQQFSERV
jgi:hypothetical protein